MTKKKQTIINGEIAIKPFYYIRNNLMHVRYTVDRAIELTDNDKKELIEEIAKDPTNKREIIAKKWNLLENFVQRDIIKDGIKAAENAYINGAN